MFNRPHVPVQQRLRLRRGSAVPAGPDRRSIRRPATPITEIIRFHRTQSVVGLRPGRLEGSTEPLDQRRPALRGLPEHLRRRAVTWRTSSSRPTTAISARASPSSRVVERHYYLEGGLLGGGMHTLAPRASFAWDPTNEGEDVDARRHRTRRTSACRTRSGMASTRTCRRSRHSRSRRQDAVPNRCSGWGAEHTLPYDYPRPYRADRRPQPAGRSAERRCGGARRRLGHQADVSRQLVPRRAAIAPRRDRRRGRLHRIQGTQRLSQVGRQPVQRRSVRRPARSSSCRGIAAINYTDSTDESSFHGGTVAAKVMKADLQFRRVVHVWPGDRLLEHVLAAAAA